MEILRINPEMDREYEKGIQLKEHEFIYVHHSRKMIGEIEFPILAPRFFREKVVEFTKKTVKSSKAIEQSKETLQKWYTTLIEEEFRRISSSSSDEENTKPRIIPFKKPQKIEIPNVMIPH